MCQEGSGGCVRPEWWLIDEIGEEVEERKGCWSRAGDREVSIPDWPQYVNMLT
jgi:hypothetical protein